MASRKPRKLRRRPHVAIIVETFLAPGRDIVRGIAKYVHEHQHWSIQLEPRRLEDSVPQWLRNWEGDGMIVRVQNRRIADAVKATKLPAVDVLGAVPDAGTPLVHVDNEAIAQQAAEHLIERGFRHFGFLGLQGANYSMQRWEAFAATIHAAEHDCSLLEVPQYARMRDSWEAHVDDIAHWVQSLRKPAGVMVCTDQRGPQLLEACRRVDLNVPDEIAVIGVDNDVTLCEVASPTLSSVCPNHTSVGYRAAELLDRMMNGDSLPTQPILQKPLGVIARLSTDVLAVDDPAIAMAVRFIRQHACEGIGVDEVVDRVALSRSVLQRRFRTLLGRSVHEEIVQTRIKRALSLLTDSDLPIGVIAEKAGFKHQEYMGAVFRAKLKRTPASIRNEESGP